MKATWSHWSKKVLGYVAEQTPKTEYYVALMKIQTHLNEGYSDSDVAKIWNQGHAGKCSSGTNKLGVHYDSCAYEQKFRLAMN
jgi:hypothetical protein